MNQALLGVLAGMVGDTGLLIAIDDSQWLDEESAGALAFALRRLDDREVRVLLAKRSDSELR